MFSCGFGYDKFVFMCPNVTAYYISKYSFVILLKNMNLTLNLLQYSLLRHTSNNMVIYKN